MTNVYTVSHTGTQIKHHLRYNKVLVKTGIYVSSGKKSECVSLFYPAKSNNLWSTQVL